MSVRKEPYKIGHVSAVDGSAITVEADHLKIRIDDKVDVHVTVGSFVNCGGDHGDVLCVVTRAWQELVERADPNNKGQRLLGDVKTVAMVVVRTIQGGFRRGVDQLPPVGSSAYFVTGDTFDALLDAALDEESKARLFPVGHRVGTGKGVARFDLDKFFGRHGDSRDSAEPPVDRGELRPVGARFIAPASPRRDESRAYGAASREVAGVSGLRCESTSARTRSTIGSERNM